MEVIESDRNDPKMLMRALEEWFARYSSCAIAFSGGVDSTLLAYTARKMLHDKAVAILSRSPALSRAEYRNAVSVANFIGIRLLVVRQDDLATPGYVTNNVNRCYFCRSNLAKAIDPIVKELRIDVRVDGTHTDDMRSPRPGIKALREAGFKAPFLELGFTKGDIRSIARLLKLPNADRPSEACLSSRIAFGHRIDSNTLSRVERAEEIVRAIVRGVKIVRVRTIGSRAVIEVDLESLALAKRRAQEIAHKLNEIGYEEVTVSEDGYVQGSMIDLFVRSERA